MTNSQGSNTSQKTNLAILIGLLVALVGTWIYFFSFKSNAEDEKLKLQALITSTDSSKNALQGEYNTALQRLDELTSMNQSMDSLVRSRNNEIQSMKVRIQKLLSKEKKTVSELAEAKRLISELNDKITGYVSEIESLKAENQQLQTEKTQLISDKESLQKDIENTRQEKEATEKELDKASTLVATNINMLSIDQRRNGKEVQKDKARRVDLIRVTFDVFNRVGNDGEKELFIIITDPTGKVVSNASLSSGQFTTREEGDKLYTKKMTVNFSAGKALPVSFDWKPEEKFSRGQYKAEIYNNGYQIGSGTKTIK